GALMLDSLEMHDWIDTTSDESGPTRANQSMQQGFQRTNGTTGPRTTGLIRSHQSQTRLTTASLRVARRGERRLILLIRYAPASALTMCPAFSLPQGGRIHFPSSVTFALQVIQSTSRLPKSLRSR